MMTPLALGAAGLFGSLFIVILLIALVATIFWIVELVDVVRRTFPDNNAKIIWFVVVFFFHLPGALIYYFVGKPTGTLQI